MFLRNASCGVLSRFTNIASCKKAHPDRAGAAIHDVFTAATGWKNHPVLKRIRESLLSSRAIVTHYRESQNLIERRLAFREKVIVRFQARRKRRGEKMGMDRRTFVMRTCIGSAGIFLGGVSALASDQVV